MQNIKIKDIKLGVIGIGSRGESLIKEAILGLDVEIVALCDLYKDKVDKMAAYIGEKTGKVPCGYCDYKELLASNDVNTVIVATSWDGHIGISIDAMTAGKITAMEVGGAYTLEQCHELVRTYEKTRTPFMFLENCCFGRIEMMVLNMVEQGVFGEIVHCAGGYHHDLRHALANGRARPEHYRLYEYLTRNCENYPTHELGPIARVLRLGHGNRMMTLTSTASKARGLREYIDRTGTDASFFDGKSFAQGDIVTTVIKCAGGETITLTLDTTLPRYYSRGFTVRGTKGFYEEATNSVFLDRSEDLCHEWDWRENGINNAAEYAKQYEHPVWREYLERGSRGGHGGMDGLMLETFFDCIRRGKDMPIDVYDAAPWMAVTVLSEMSVARGGAPVDFPDFTCGRWQMYGGRH